MNAHGGNRNYIFFSFYNSEEESQNCFKYALDLNFSGFFIFIVTYTFFEYATAHRQKTREKKTETYTFVI